MVLKDELRQFVTESFMFGKPCEGFADDDSFLERGIIDSTAIMELVAFLEGHYRIKLQDRELIADNFDSVNKLARFVASRLEPNCTVAPDRRRVAPDSPFFRLAGKNGTSI
jgi:acyl carrier protein